MSRHQTIGPALTVALAAIALIVQWHVVRTPAPAALPFLGVLYSAYVGGVAPGLISAGITILFGLAFNSDPGQLFSFSAEAKLRMVVLSITVVLAALLLGLLRRRANELLRNERYARRRAEASNRELMTLRAALNQIDHGIILLDREMRAQFINHACRRLWGIPAELADANPTFETIVREARKRGAYATPSDQIDEFVRARIARVLDGDDKLEDLRLSNGRVVRFQCTRLPEGGRMLNYSDVTDLVRQADEMSQLASLDDMSGLYNRRHFQLAAQGRLADAQQARQPLSLMIVDIDHFKAINDRFGHAAGDDVIRRLADLCRAGAGPGDILGRLGGDEFVVLMPGTDLDAACVAAERLRSAVCAAPIVADGEAVNLTVSIGVAATSAEIRDLATLMKRADAALYRAKRSERNRVAATRTARPVIAA